MIPTVETAFARALIEAGRALPMPSRPYLVAMLAALEVEPPTLAYLAEGIGAAPDGYSDGALAAGEWIAAQAALVGVPPEHAEAMLPTLAAIRARIDPEWLAPALAVLNALGAEALAFDPPGAVRH